MVPKKKSMPMGGFGKAPIALFLVLIISGASIFAITWQDSPKASKGSTFVDADGILQAFLSSTMDEVIYTDASGRAHVYSGWTVQELIVEDLELRSNTTTKANTTSLTKGLEAAFGKMLDDLSGDHHYNLKATFGRANFRTKDLDLEGGATSTTSIHMRSYEAEAKVSLSLTQ